MSSGGHLHTGETHRQSSAVLNSPPLETPENTQISNATSDDGSLDPDQSGHEEVVQEQNIADMSAAEVDSEFRKMFASPEVKIELVRSEAEKSPYWGAHFPNIKSIPNWKGRFNRITGALRLDEPHLVARDELREFFDKDHKEFRVYNRKGRIENRGEAYYIAHKQNLPVTLRLRYLSRTATSAVEAIRQNYHDRSEMSKEDYVYFLGVLDNLKNVSLTIFNAYIFPERQNIFAHSATQSDLMLRESLFDSTDRITRMYYQALTGYPFDITEEDLNRIESSLATAVNRLRAEKDIMYPEKSQDSSKRFKIQEVDHPLLIAANAHANANQFGQVDWVIGLPFGGLQASFANRFAMQIVHGSLPSILAVPLSTHSGWKRNHNRLSATDIECYVRQKMDLSSEYNRENPHPTLSVLVTDDNTNSGLTLNIMRDSLVSSGIHPKNIHMSVVEHDPRRIRIKQSDFDLGTMRPSKSRAQAEDFLELTDTIANPNYFETAAGIVPMRALSVDRNTQPNDTQARRDYANLVLGQPESSYQYIPTHEHREKTRELRRWLQEA